MTAAAVAAAAAVAILSRGGLQKLQVSYPNCFQLSHVQVIRMTVKLKAHVSHQGSGGNLNGCPSGNPLRNGCAPGGYGHGPDGRYLLGNSNPPRWKAGSVVEVGFGVTRNHGGGYQYRICRYNGGAPGMTEDCFQKNPLPFVGKTQWLQWDDNRQNRTAIIAVRTTNLTTPTGSMWTRNPISVFRSPQAERSCPIPGRRATALRG